MPNAVLLLVYLLAVARVTRLITSDRITERPREAAIEAAWAHAWMAWARDTFPRAREDKALARQHAHIQGRQVRANGGEPPLLAYLIACPWCVSIYVGAVAAPMIWFWGESPWLAIPALALALSHGTGVLASKGE